MHTLWNPSLHVKEHETGRSLRRAIPRITKVYSLQRTATAMTLHGRNSTSYTPQYTVMSPLQSKCQPSKAFHPAAAAEQHHLRCTCVSSSFSYRAKTAKTETLFWCYQLASISKWLTVDSFDPFDFSAVTTLSLSLSRSELFQLSAALSTWLLINKTR